MGKYIGKPSLWERFVDWRITIIGKWYLKLWESNTRLIEIGFGTPHVTEGNWGAFFVKIRYFWKFYLVVSKPTLKYLRQREKVKYCPEDLM